MEGRLGEQSVMFAGLLQTMVELRQDVNARFSHVDTRFTDLNHKVDALGVRLDGKIDALSERMNTQFRWTAGLIVSCLLAIIGAGITVVVNGR